MNDVPARPGSGGKRPAPFRQVDAARRELREGVAGTTTDGSMARDLTGAVEILERVHAVAVEMQEGAESFDNTDRARFYDAVRQHVVAAADEVVRACGMLVGEQRSALLRLHLPKLEVLTRLQDGRRRLESALEGLDAATAAVDGHASPSVHDRLARLIARERRAGDRLRRALARHQFDAASVDGDAGYDAGEAEALSGRTFGELLDLWRASSGELVATVEAMSEDDFAPEGVVARALGESLHLVLAGASYGRYAEIEEAIARLGASS